MVVYGVRAFVCCCSWLWLFVYCLMLLVIGFFLNFVLLCPLFIVDCVFVGCCLCSCLLLFVTLIIFVCKNWKSCILTFVSCHLSYLLLCVMLFVVVFEFDYMFFCGLAFCCLWFCLLSFCCLLFCGLWWNSPGNNQQITDNKPTQQQASKQTQIQTTTHKQSTTNPRNKQIANTKLSSSKQATQHPSNNKQKPIRTKKKKSKQLVTNPSDNKQTSNTAKQLPISR